MQFNEVSRLISIFAQIFLNDENFIMMGLSWSSCYLDIIDGGFAECRLNFEVAGNSGDEVKSVKEIQIFPLLADLERIV